MFNGFPHQSTGQDIMIIKRGGAVNKQNVDVRLQPEILEPVIEDQDVCSVVGIAGYVIKNHIFNVGSIRVNTVDGYLFTIPILITAFYGNGNFYQVAVILRKVGIKASQSVLCRVQLTVFLLNASECSHCNYGECSYCGGRGYSRVRCTECHLVDSGES